MEAKAKTTTKQIKLINWFYEDGHHTQHSRAQVKRKQKCLKRVFYIDAENMQASIALCDIVTINKCT